MQPVTLSRILRIGAGILVGVGLYHLMTRSKGESVVDKTVESVKDAVDVPFKVIEKAKDIVFSKKAAAKQTAKELTEKTGREHITLSKGVDANLR